MAGPRERKKKKERQATVAQVGERNGEGRHLGSCAGYQEGRWRGCDPFLTTKVLLAIIKTVLAVCPHTQSCPTLCNPMECSPPGSSVHRISQARTLEWVCHFLLQEIVLTWGLNPHLLGFLHWQADPLPRAPSGKPLRMLNH